MTGFAFTTETVQQEDDSWRDTDHGDENAETIVVDRSIGFVAGDFVNSYLPGGHPLGKVTTAGANFGHYGKFDPAANDGRQVLAGHLFKSIRAKVGTDAVKRPAALYSHGRVRHNRLPAGHNLSAAIINANGAPMAAVRNSIKYVGVA